MPIVNGHQADTGCYVEGHWGQYGPDRLAEQAERFGWAPGHADDDPRVIRRFITMIEEAGYDDGDYVNVTSFLWECHTETADEIETWLNEHTPEQCGVCGDPVAWDDKSEMYRHLGNRQHGARDIERFTWHWHDGEFFLSPICENGDCDDDTCAHWD